MDNNHDFSFGDDSVANAYDNGLVPILFEPWAARLVEEYGPWKGRRVLDLATGTGIVARLLASKVGSSGKVVATDINAEMLAVAKRRCNGVTPAIDFVESPAHPLEIASKSIDVVVCQQGFQFFPDKLEAAQEAHRVLDDGGRVIATTWCPVSECQFFGSIVDVLEGLGESGISDHMRIPFDFMPDKDLADHFESAGFANVRVRREERDLLIDGGVKQAVEVAYSTPIAPKLREMPEQKQSEFREALAERLSGLRDGGTTMGRMASNVLSAEKS